MRKIIENVIAFSALASAFFLVMGSGMFIPLGSVAVGLLLSICVYDMVNGDD